MNRKRYFLICGTMILAALATGLALYSRMPERIPTNWDYYGSVCAYSSRATGIFFLPGVMSGFLLLFALLPALSPRGFELDSFRSTYLFKGIVLVATTGYLQGILLWEAVSPSSRLSAPRATIVGLCVAVALLGNVLSKVKRNFYMGVRTPWTLASEPVWYATHRFAAKSVVGASALGFILAFVIPHPAPVVFLLLAGCLIPTIYSLVYYKRLERQNALRASTN